MPYAPNRKTYYAHNAEELARAAADIDTNPPLGDAQSWLEWAAEMLDEAAGAMTELEEKCDALEKRVAELENA